jgi:hypothetical protein
MLLVYSSHAKRRMKQRGITDSDVRHCLRNYHQRVLSRDSAIYQADVGGRTLKVMIAPDRDTDVEKFVITTAWRDDDDS